MISCLRCGSSLSLVNKSETCSFCLEEYCEMCAVFCEHGFVMGTTCTPCPSCNQVITLCHGITLCSEHSCSLRECSTHQAPSLGEC